MKKMLFVALIFCTSLLFGETDELSFTEEPMEEEVVEDQAFLELLKTAIVPELHSLDTPQQEETKIVHTPLSFVSEEELAKEEVEKFRKLYLSPKWSTLLKAYLESAMEYRLYVRKAIQDAQMPEMLEYLPVVESNYKTSAKSRSGAIGMWQFMANSVWPFLTLNDFVDERLDPWKSTDAALKKLTDNYNYFNDWLRAIGAYNCGVGAMSKAIKKPAVKKTSGILQKTVIFQNRQQNMFQNSLQLLTLQLTANTTV